MAQQAEHTYDLFISYAEGDQSWVYGYLVPALGLPPERVMTRSAFTPGAPVVTEFERAVTSSRYTLLVLSPAYLADEWSSLGEHLASYLTIDQQQERLIPLRLQPCDLPLRISFRVGLDCTDKANWESEIARLRALLDRPEPVLSKIECPYPGMVPFRADDARFFYGREAEIGDMLQRLRHQGFFVVIGDSGSGKSSLINAGLLPKLDESTFFPPGYWLVRTMRPGSQPLQSLSQVVGADLAQPAQAVSDLLAAHPPAQRLLLVVDPFEELFTQVSRPDQSQFIAALQALRATESCAIVTALRSDFFYTDLKGSDLWPVALSERLEIDPLRGEALRDAIEKPAAREGVYLEQGLVELLLKDAADERGVLPLVQETMVQLWDRMEGRLIPLEAYEQLGGGERSGLAGALVTKANATLATLAHRSPDHEAIAQRILVRLVQFGEGRPDTRRQQPESALRSWADDSQVFDQTLRHLAENRLLTLSGEEEDRDRKVDIAHEALFTEWPALEERVRAWRRPEQMRRQLEGWAADWISRNRDPKALLNELELSQAEEWLNGPAAGELGHSQGLTDLVRVSRTALDEEAARQSSIRRFRLVALAAISLLIIIVLAAVAVGQFRVTQEQERMVETAEAFGQAQATLVVQEREARETAVAERQRAADLADDLLLRQLILQSEALWDDRNDQSLLLSIEAFRLADTIETRDNLLRVLRTEPEVVRYIRDSDGPRAIAFSPDGGTLVALTGGGIRVWSARTGKALEPASTEIDGSTVTSRDGQTGFSAEGDTIVAWDLASNQSLGFLGGTQTTGWLKVLSPDGKIVASGSGDRAVVIQDAITGEELARLQGGRRRALQGMAFSPGGQFLATVVDFVDDLPITMVFVWELWVEDYGDEQYLSGGVVAQWSFFGDEYGSRGASVTDMTFSLDGQYLAVTVPESTDVVYLLADGDEERQELWKGETSFDSVACTSLTSACEGLLAAGREDGKIIFHAISSRVDTSQSPLTHPGPVEGLAFSPDCRRLASMGGGVIVLWNLRAEELTQLFEPIEAELTETRLVPDDEPRAWDYSGEVSNSECILRAGTQDDPDAPCVRSAIEGGFAGFSGIVTSLATSPDGNALAAGICNDYLYDDRDPWYCDASEVWYWPGGPSEGVNLGDQDCAVTDLVFSPDGKVLASVNQDGVIKLWDVDLESLIARACYKANRNLTEDEWRTFMGPDRPYRVTCSSLEGPDPSRSDAALKQIEPLLRTLAPTSTPTPTTTTSKPPGTGA